MIGGRLKAKIRRFHDSNPGNAPLQSTLIVAVAAVILVGLLNVGRLMQEQSQQKFAELLASASGNSVGTTSSVPFSTSPAGMQPYGDKSQDSGFHAAADSVEGSKPIDPAPQEPGTGGPQEPVPVNGPDPTKEPVTGTEPEPVAGGDPEPDPNDPEAEPKTSKAAKKRKAKKKSQGSGDPETVLQPEGSEVAEGQGLPTGLGAGMNPMSMLSGGIPAFGSPSAFGPQSQGSGFNSGSGFPSNGFPSGGSGGQSAGGQYSSPIADSLRGFSGLDTQDQFSEPRQRRSQSPRRSKDDTSEEADEPKEKAEQLAGRRDRSASGSKFESVQAESSNRSADELEAVRDISLGEPLSEPASDPLQILGLDRTPGKGPRITIRCEEQFEYIEVSGGGQKLRYKAPMPGRSGNIPLISAGQTIGGIEITGVSGASRVTRTYVVPEPPLAGSDSEPIPGQQLESDDVESGDPETGDAGKTEVVNAEPEL
ncbi:MAG: hypothetical protein JNL58_17105 [Planctomyces sp.]|nr:hypothetical protein [Planctomyces sp.]